MRELSVSEQRYRRTTACGVLDVSTRCDQVNIDARPVDAAISSPVQGVRPARRCSASSESSSNTAVADFQIAGGVSGGVESIPLTIARAYPCGTGRLFRVVGAESVVQTMYQLTASAYLDATAVSAAPLPNDSDASLSLSSHQLSALDMASGMQTIANEGMHHDPYFVEYIDDAEGNRLYTHRLDDERVLSADTSLATIDILKDVIISGTGRRATLDDDRPAVGVTGTASDNANAWFVGATPQITTAVWVGDPAANTPMVQIPEFADAGVNRVQGGNFPADIWKAFTDTALAGTPTTDWASPPEPNRPPARVIVPSVECRAGDATDGRPRPIEPQQPVTTLVVTTACSATSPMRMMLTPRDRS